MQPHLFILVTVGVCTLISAQILFDDYEPQKLDDLLRMQSLINRALKKTSEETNKQAETVQPPVIHRPHCLFFSMKGCITSAQDRRLWQHFNDMVRYVHVR